MRGIASGLLRNACQNPTARSPLFQRMAPAPPAQPRVPTQTEMAAREARMRSGEFFHHMSVSRKPPICVAGTKVGRERY